MRTKFLLHGGGTDLPTESNLLFYKELTSHAKVDGNLLLIYLAREEEKWNSLLEKDKLKFSTETQESTLNFTIASKNIKTLESQIKAAKTIFIRGGLTSDLLSYFKQLSSDCIKDLMKDKLIGASSAGAYIFSKYYYANSLDKIESGLGLLSIKLICHYIDESEDKAIKLKDYNEDLPLFRIHEGEHVKYSDGE